VASVRRWLLRILGGIALVVVAAIMVIYIISSRYIDRRYPVRQVAITLPTDTAAVARGARLAHLACIGCHGDSLQGQVFFDVPGVARISAPNALDRLTKYTDAEFAGLLRYGVHRDGSATFIMAPPGFYHMADADAASLLAYLRSMPKAAGPTLPADSYRLMGRLGIALGQFKNTVEDRDTTTPRVGGDPAYLSTRQGEYFARMICSGCHGTPLTGDPQMPSPSIVLAVGYSLPEFVTLLREGKPRVEKTIATMGEVAQKQLHNLTDAEIAAIYAYIRALPATGVPTGK
jgi:cytochrome c553